MKTRTILFSLALAGIAAFVTSCSPSSLTGDETSQQSLEIPNNVILYKSTTGTIVIPYDVNAFGANIVSNTYSEDGVGRIVFDADLKEIGYGAFMNCDELVSITLPNSITTMGQGETFHVNGISFTLCGAVFAGCEHLTSVHLPTALSYLPGGTFSIKKIRIR